MRRGFTLLELSIVLAIIALIVGGSFVTLTASMQADQFNATVARMDAIEAALVNYSAMNNRLPCPANLSTVSGNANYGIEAANTGSCWGGTPAASFKAASNTVEGGVPTRTLRLPDDYMYDAWGRRFRYAVDPTYTAATGSLPVTTSCSLSPTANTSALTINDYSGTPRSTRAAYALVSHGTNGHGAYTSNAAVVNASSTNASEQTNCHCNASAVAAAYSPAYVEMTPTADSSSSTNSFDDIVTFREAWQLQTPTAPLSASTCSQYLYVAEWTNHRVQKLNTSGMFILGIGAGYNGVTGSVGACGSASGQLCYPSGVVSDSSGNIYVADNNNNRVQKFNSNGTFQLAIGSGYQGVGGSIGATGSSNGMFNFTSTGMIAQVALDSTGNLWVADSGNNRVQEFSSSGAYLGKITGFDQPHAVNVDSGGNIWVKVNGSTCKFYKCASGTTTVGSCTAYGNGCGSGNGSFYNTTFDDDYISFDSSGNVWITDETNSRIQKFNSSGVYQSNLSWSHATGQMFDSSGNLWISTESGVDTLSKVNSSTGAVISTVGSHGSANGQLTDVQQLYIGY